MFAPTAGQDPYEIDFVLGSGVFQFAIELETAQGRELNWPAGVEGRIEFQTEDGPVILPGLVSDSVMSWNVAPEITADVPAKSVGKMYVGGVYYMTGRVRRRD